MKLVRFMAVILTALAIVPGVAHVLELPQKAGLGRHDYLTVQEIYRGWAWLGALLAAAFIAVGLLAYETRQQTTSFLFALGGLMSLAASFMIFFVWTYPVNQVTKNWTTAPDDWERLRSQWEFSHAANAAVVLLALCLVVLSVLSSRNA